MAQFVEVLRTGLTMRSQVRRAGDRVQLTYEFNLLSKKAQVQKWGAPRYRKITREDFEGGGGKVLHNDPNPAPEVPEVPEVATGEKVETPSNPFAAFEDKNVEETLALAAELSESDLEAFIAYEQEGAGRVGVLMALGVSTE